jgi:hypothetical protein
VSNRHQIIKCQEDGWRYLACCVVEQSVKDYLSDDAVDFTDSLLWWLDDGPVFVETLGWTWSPDQIYRWLFGGCTRYGETDKTKSRRFVRVGPETNGGDDAPGAG